jgi:rubrerythrin
MERFDLEAYVRRSRALDLSGVRWQDVPAYPLSPEALRVLRYMQDIESHTIVYLRTLLSTRAIDDPEVATFLACWLYEETFHGRALARFVAVAGGDIVQRTRSRSSWGERIEAILTAMVARAWPDFVAVHMTWGAINELTTLTGYQRLAAMADHPVLTDLLARIVRDESRHFLFYFRQAERRLHAPRTARVSRFLVDRFWAPVGSGVQPASETRFLARYLFSGAEGRSAARRVDEQIRRLPGFADVALLEAWIDREAATRHRDVTPAPLVDLAALEPANRA